MINNQMEMINSMFSFFSFYINLIIFIYKQIYRSFFFFEKAIYRSLSNLYKQNFETYMFLIFIDVFDPFLTRIYLFIFNIIRTH